MVVAVSVVVVVVSIIFRVIVIVDVEVEAGFSVGWTAAMVFHGIHEPRK